VCDGGGEHCVRERTVKFFLFCANNAFHFSRLGWMERGGDEVEEHGVAHTKKKFSPSHKTHAHHNNTMEDNVACLTVETKPFEGQKPGTSGLRKKVCRGLAAGRFFGRRAQQCLDRPAVHAALAPAGRLMRSCHRLLMQWPRAADACLSAQRVAKRAGAVHGALRRPRPFFAAHPARSGVRSTRADQPPPLTTTLSQNTRTTTTGHRLPAGALPGQLCAGHV
jgi:hypothetical protein